MHEQGARAQQAEPFEPAHGANAWRLESRRQTSERVQQVGERTVPGAQELLLLGQLGTVHREMAAVADAIEEAVDDHDDRLFISFEGQEISYADFDKRANQFAHWGKAAGLRKGDCVALFMENRPDYIAFWAGMSKIAVKVALINYNLTGPGLSHCVKITNARAIVMNPELAPQFESARDQTPLDLGAFVLGGAAAGMTQIDAGVDKAWTERPNKSVRAGVKGGEVALYIYTSGTTGLPKAAKISHVRARGLMRVFKDATEAHANDRILLTLPLYHATGGMCGVGTALNAGACIILRRKFSASHFLAGSDRQ